MVNAFILLMQWFLMPLVEDSHSLLIRAGFIRQVSGKDEYLIRTRLTISGRRMPEFFNFFPWDCGYRTRLRNLSINTWPDLVWAYPQHVLHCRDLTVYPGASKLSLSTFSSEELWQKTGRLDSNNSEVGLHCILVFWSTRLMDDL